MGRRVGNKEKIKGLNNLLNTLWELLTQEYSMYNSHHRKTANTEDPDHKHTQSRRGRETARHISRLDFWPIRKEHAPRNGPPGTLRRLRSPSGNISLRYCYDRPKGRRLDRSEQTIEILPIFDPAQKSLEFESQFGPDRKQPVAKKHEIIK
jgi:hypothetical protein